MSMIVIPESYWANTQLSIARYTGRVRIEGHEFILVDKRGRDIFQCSIEAEREGRTKAIEPGEPADLCRKDFLPLYGELGREEFIRFIRENPDIDDIKIARKWLKALKQKN